MERNIHVALENLRSLHNIGSIFRTCAFFGVKSVVLVGYSGKTKDLDGETILHKDVSKASLGSEKYLNITFLDSPFDLIDFAKQKNIKITAVEQSKDSIKLEDLERSDNTIFVFGNEVSGVSKDILNAASEIVEIKGTKLHNSLNVSVVCGIVLNFVK